MLPHLSYAVSAWAPYNKGDHRAVIMVTNLKGSYEERLAVLGMRKLEDRRVRGDLIETFKILTGKSKVDLKTWFNITEKKE